MKKWHRRRLSNKLPPLRGWRSILPILLVFVSRLGFLPANFSPVGALGFYNRSPLPLLLVTFGFDLWRGGFYHGFWWTYLGFTAYWLFGRLATGRLRRQLLFLPLASLAFFVLSNFGAWLYWYPRTLEGLVACYTLALPFYRNTLLGDLLFGWGWVVAKNYRSSILTLVSSLRRQPIALHFPAISEKEPQSVR